MVDDSELLRYSEAWLDVLLTGKRWASRVVCGESKAINQASGQKAEGSWSIPATVVQMEATHGSQ